MRLPLIEISPKIHKTEESADKSKVVAVAQENLVHTSGKNLLSRYGRKLRSLVNYRE